jgi:hypothetical protein
MSWRPNAITHKEYSDGEYSRAQAEIPHNSNGEYSKLEYCRELSL